MSIQIEHKNGALVYFDNTKSYGPWVDAFGQDVIKHEIGQGVPTDDTTGDPSQFAMTVTEAGTGNTTVVNSATAGESLLITTAANEYDGVNLQMKGEAFKLEAGKPLYFGAALKISDATQSDLLIGLCETDTTLMATSSAHAIAVSGDGAFFSKLDGSTTLAAKAYLDGSQTATANHGTALTAATEILVEMMWDGVNLKFYVDETLTQTINSGLPDGDLTFSVNYRAGAAAAKTASILWVKVIQLRG